MITAKEARKRSEAYEPKWNIFDTIQLKRIEHSIKFWSRFGRKSISFGGLFNINGVRPLVCEKLKKEGYRIEFHGARDMWWDEIYF